jgi:hypothetical protein
MIIFKKLFLTEEEVKIAISKGIRYTKWNKNQFKKMSKLEPPDEDKISLLQAKIGKLPDDYIKFLMKFNGGNPKPNCIKFEDEIFIVNNLLVTAGSEKIYSSIENYCEVFKNRIPLNTIPIGTSPGGDLFLIDLNAENFGKIYYWDHEEESDDDGSYFFENITPLFNSFDDFINSIIEIKDENENES